MYVNNVQQTKNKQIKTDWMEIYKIGLLSKIRNQLWMSCDVLFRSFSIFHPRFVLLIRKYDLQLIILISCKML